ncbi:hypothetical protein FNV43_RR21661 [Rhamnella rubrinervis]|uniref:Uncharacterized protein n=1 Tax=Rhamnella rubrinervis TaxID=2594499 RepID=A0A8K0GRC5_9ROSA|nr:hypothetical protein FNV43_RR21661 [Rhamnella rubrinervis]
MLVPPSRMKLNSNNIFIYIKNLKTHLGLKFQENPQTPLLISTYDSNNDITTISQAIKKRRTATSNTGRAPPTNKKKIHVAKKVLIEMVDTRFDIITEEEAQNNYRKSLAILLDTGFFPDSMKPSISKFLNSLHKELVTFNKFCRNSFIASSHCSSMISLQISIQCKVSEYTTASAKLATQEYLVEELKAKIVEVDDICRNLWCSIQLTIDEAKKKKRLYIDLLSASKNKDEARVQAEVAIVMTHLSVL